MNSNPDRRLTSANKAINARLHGYTNSRVQQQRRASFISTPGGVRVLLTIGVVALANLPLFAAFCSSLWARPHYQFFPLVPVGAAFLLFLRIRQDGVRDLFGAGGYLLPLTTWMLLATAVLADSPWLGMIACLAAIVGIGGWPLFGRIYPIWCFLFIIVPAPFAADDELIRRLQSLTAVGASAVLDVFGVYHHLMGNVVEVAGRRFLVEEACSGISSLLVTITCTLFFILWKRRPWYHGVLLLLAASCWVLCENVARVAGVVAVTCYTGFDLSVGRPHIFFGLGLFCATLGATWSTDRLLLLLLAPGPIETSAEEAATPPLRGFPAVDLHRSWLMSAPLAAAFIVIGVGQFLFLPRSLWNDPAISRASIEPALAAIEEDALPANIGPWHRAEFQVVRREKSDQMAEASRSWNYLWPERHLSAGVSLDYPYAKYHDLALCYRAIGWDVLQGTTRSLDDDPTTTYVQLDMRKRPVPRATVLFSEFDRNGRTVSEPHTPAMMGLIGRVRSRLARFSDPRFPHRPSPAPVIDQPVLEVQLLVEHSQPLSEDSVAEVNQLFRESLMRLQAKFVTGSQARGEQPSELTGPAVR
jgi:exosortase